MRLRERLFALETFGIKLGLDNIQTILTALGSAGPALARHSCRGHQRQGIGHGDGRARPARQRLSHRPLHVAAPRSHRGTRRHRRRARRCAGLRSRDARSLRGDRSTHGERRSRGDAHVLRSHDRNRVRDLRAREGHGGGHRGRTRGPVRRDQRHYAGDVRYHVDRVRPRAPSRTYARGDRLREGRHHQTRGPGRRWRRAS